jgi:hypothetical protein
MLGSNNFALTANLNKASSSDIDLEDLQNRRNKVMSDCGLAPPKFDMSSESSAKDLQDTEALQEEARREMQAAADMIERLEREE